MATIVVADRTVDSKTSRNRVTGIDLKVTVSELKNKISTTINKEKDFEFDLVYCGRCLEPSSSLESNGISSGSTVHALKRVCATPSESEASVTAATNAEVKQVQQLLHTAIKNPAYKSTVENILNNAQTLHDFVNAVPGLGQHPDTLVLFLDQELLSVLAHPGNIKRLIEAHPYFVPVARMISAAVSEAETKGEYVRSSTGSYSLDQMSDDDEPPVATGQPITANQLAAALAAATGIPPTSQPSPGPSNSNNTISSDFFQQAILQAQSAAITGQIAQMREMGITDENIARQALQATNGDLQAALDLIFGGGFT